MKLRCYAKCPRCGTEAQVDQEMYGFVNGNCPKCQVRFVTTGYWWEME